MRSASHLLWLPAGALVAFAAAFVFSDLLKLPVDLYYLVYFVSVLGFLTVYVRTTGLDLSGWLSRRWVAGVVAGVLGGIVLMQGVLAGPQTGALSGTMLAWAVFWRGLVYGIVDGLLLFAFPWIVVWRALRADGDGWRRKAGAGAAAWVAVLLVTTVYHLGYADFRSAKIVQPNVGSTIAVMPTLITTSPIASPISHVVLHMTAVVHTPDSELYLPPHRRQRHAALERAQPLASEASFSRSAGLADAGSPPGRAGPALERAHHVGGDPAAVEVPRLRVHAFVVHPAGVDTAGIEAHVVAQRFVARPRIGVGPGHGCAAVLTEDGVVVPRGALELTHRAPLVREQQVHADVRHGEVPGRRMAGLQHPQRPQRVREHHVPDLYPHPPRRRLDRRRPGIVPDRLRHMADLRRSVREKSDRRQKSRLDGPGIRRSLNDVRRDATSVLKSHGIKPSAQRLAIAEYVLHTDTHPSADDVFTRVRKRFPDVSRATVYNTLNLLVERGLLRQFVLTEGRVVFDPNMEDHHHFIDEASGKIHDIPWHALEVSNISKLEGFDVRQYQVVMRGQKTSSKRRRRS